MFERIFRNKVKEAELNTKQAAAAHEAKLNKRIAERLKHYNIDEDDSVSNFSEIDFKENSDNTLNITASSLAESLGHPASSEQLDAMRSITDDIVEKQREWDKERSKELKAMDKDPSLVQNDTDFQNFKKYLDTLPPKIQQSALGLLQDSYNQQDQLT